MINLFASNRTLLLLLLPLLGFFYHLGFHFSGPYVDHSASFGLWGTFHPKEIMGKNALWLVPFSSFILVLINAVTVNAIYNEHEFQERNSYLPALIYVGVSTTFASFYRIESTHFIHLFVVLFLHQVFLLKPNDKNVNLIFNAGFFIAVAATLSPVLCIGLPIYISIIFLSRAIHAKEVLLFLLGFILPFYFVFSFQYIAFHRLSVAPFTFVSLNRSFNPTLIYTLIISFLIILFSFWGSRNRFNTASTRLRKHLQAVELLMIALILAILLSWFLVKSPIQLERLIIPVAILFPFALLSKTGSALSRGFFYILLLINFIKILVLP